MYGLESDVFDQLVRMKNEFGVRYVKAEFEAEGSSFRDVLRLRRLTTQAGIGLVLKIGGCESVRDLRDAVELGADGLVAPMIESPFALSKFWEAVSKVYRTGRRPRLAFNVETKSCVEQLEGILDYGAGKFDGFTIGRTDLAASYFDPFVTPDSPFLLDVVEQITSTARARGWEVWMGGSLSQRSIAALSVRELKAEITHLETRKVVLSSAVLYDQPEAVAEALKFEELYLLSRQEILEGPLQEDRERLKVLQTRR